MGRRNGIIEDPYNAETPLDRIDGQAVPVGDFFVRSHFAVPLLDAASWRCPVGGAVATPLTLDLATLRAMPSRRLAVTLECAGNGRTLIRPEVKGAPWRLGGVGTAEFEGVALRDVLDRAGVREDAVEVACCGADEGVVTGDRRVAFERSLPIGIALDPDVLVAWSMNGAPLAPEHGSPARLVVPGWYGVASVKWLAGIRALTEPYFGYFQGEAYVYRGSALYPENAPVTTVRVRSSISRPAAGTSVERGPLALAGSAWSGDGAITRVELSADDGVSWSEATLGAPISPRAATPWTAFLRLESAGPVVILSRATDAAGNVQPTEPPWNELGYGNNAAQRVSIRVA